MFCKVQVHNDEFHTMATSLIALLMTIALTSAAPGVKSKREVTSLTVSGYGANGFLTTPNYPDDYNKNNTYTTYEIRSTNNLTDFAVDFYACDCRIETHYEPGCQYDAISVGKHGEGHCGDLTEQTFTAQSMDGYEEVSFYAGSEVSFPGCYIVYGLSSDSYDLSAGCPAHKPRSGVTIPPPSDCTSH